MKLWTYFYLPRTKKVDLDTEEMLLKIDNDKIVDNINELGKKLKKN